LSTSAEKDSGGADIDVYQDAIAIVWAEGTTARGLNDGVVMLAWKPNQNSPWQMRMVPGQVEGFAHYQPSVALYGQTAHVAWVRSDIEGTGLGDNRISYAQCMLDTGICTEVPGISGEDAVETRLAPDIAVDAFGVPHVVWIRQSTAQVGRVWYNTRVGGQWGSPEAVSGGGSELCTYTQDNPAIAADDKHVHVAWDENVGDCAAAAGIYFRQRQSVTASAGSGTWQPGAVTAGAPWGKQLSQVATETERNVSEVDGFPTLDTGAGWTYVMWERFVHSQTIPFYGGVYTYALPYRVYTGTQPRTDWWPGGAAPNRWASLPFTATSATDVADFYQGLRPSLKLAGKMPHVVWHQWDPPSASAAAQAIAEGSRELGSEGQLQDERLVSDQNPYRVLWARYSPGTDPLDLPKAQSSWISTALQVLEHDRILASADLALSQTQGGAPELHIALARRAHYLSADRSFAWDVWYTNDSRFVSSYFPVLMRP
jgi:hypothetical protein